MMKNHTTTRFQAHCPTFSVRVPGSDVELTPANMEVIARNGNRLLYRGDPNRFFEKQYVVLDVKTKEFWDCQQYEGTALKVLAGLS